MGKKTRLPRQPRFMHFFLYYSFRRFTLYVIYYAYISYHLIVRLVNKLNLIPTTYEPRYLLKNNENSDHQRNIFFEGRVDRKVISYPNDFIVWYIISCSCISINIILWTILLPLIEISLPPRILKLKYQTTYKWVGFYTQ